MNSSGTSSVVTKGRALQHYFWGKNCEAWTLVDTAELTVKLEKMPAASEEILHYHKQSLQFFYITKGKAVFEVDEVILIVDEGEGLQIEAERKHRIMNKEETDLEFLVCSQPSAEKDRFNIV